MLTPVKQRMMMCWHLKWKTLQRGAWQWIPRPASKKYQWQKVSHYQTHNRTRLRQ